MSFYVYVFFFFVGDLSWACMLIPFAFAGKNQAWEKRDCGVSGIGERNYFGFLFFGSHVSILNSII